MLDLKHNWKLIVLFYVCYRKDCQQSCSLFELVKNYWFYFFAIFFLFCFVLHVKGGMVVLLLLKCTKLEVVQYKITK